MILDFALMFVRWRGQVIHVPRYGRQFDAQKQSFTYSSTDNFLSLNPVSDWLIFCHRNYDVAFITLNPPHWPVMWHAPNFRDRRKYRWLAIFSGTHSPQTFDIRLDYQGYSFVDDTPILTLCSYFSPMLQNKEAF